MKNLVIVITILALISSCEKSATESKSFSYVGVYEDLSNHKVQYHSVDLIDGQFEKITDLENITAVRQGVFTYDNNNNYFILQTNLGITVVDVESGEIVKTFDGISEIEYNPGNSLLYGIFWDMGLQKEFFASADIVSGEVSVISELPGVTAILQGNSTFDYDLGRYCFVSGDFGVVVVDIQDGKILNTFTGIKDIEYDHNSGKLIGLSGELGRQLSSADLATGEIQVIGEIPIEAVVQGVSTYDQENNYYIILTNLGITVIDVNSCSIINSFQGLTEIEYLNMYTKQ